MIERQPFGFLLCSSKAAPFLVAIGLPLPVSPAVGVLAAQPMSKEAIDFRYYKCRIGHSMDVMHG